MVRQFFEKGFHFSENLFQRKKVLKMLKISGDCYIKNMLICRMEGNFAVKLAEKSSHSYSVYLTNQIFQTSAHLYSLYVTMECKVINGLYKYIKKVRSSQEKNKFL